MFREGGKQIDAELIQKILEVSNIDQRAVMACRHTAAIVASADSVKSDAIGC
jgi:hypothetical protein